MRVLADSSINISVKPWANVADYGPVRGEINKAIVEAFRERNIVIPFPQHDVRLVGNALLQDALGESRRLAQSA